MRRLSGAPALAHGLGHRGHAGVTRRARTGRPAGLGRGCRPPGRLGRTPGALRATTRSAPTASAATCSPESSPPPGSPCVLALAAVAARRELGVAARGLHRRPRPARPPVDRRADQPPARLPGALLVRCSSRSSSARAPPGRCWPSRPRASPDSPGSPRPSPPASRAPTTWPPPRVLGVRRHRLLWRHVLPNIAEPLLLSTTTAAGTALRRARRAQLPRPRRPAARLRLGPAAQRGPPRDLRRPAARARPPAWPSSLAALAFNLLGEASRGFGVPASGRGAARRRAPPRRADRRRRGEPARAPTRPPDRRGARRPGPHASLPRRRRPDRPVGASPSPRPGEIVGLVGESGSGKSLTALAVSPARRGARRVRRTLRLLGTDCSTARRTPDRSARHRPRGGLPGPDLVAQPRPRGSAPSSPRSPAVHRGTRRRAAHARAIDRCARSRIRDRGAALSSTPTSSPAACASAR